MQGDKCHHILTVSNGLQNQHMFLHKQCIKCLFWAQNFKVGPKFCSHWNRFITSAACKSQAYWIEDNRSSLFIALTILDLFFVNYIVCSCMSQTSKSSVYCNGSAEVAHRHPTKYYLGDVIKCSHILTKHFLFCRLQRLALKRYLLAIYITQLLN